MFDDRIRKQGGDEYVIRSAVRVHGGDGGVEAGHAFAAATCIACGVMMVVGALLLYRLVLLHADHPVGVVVMGNNGGYQHNDVDKE